MLFLHVRITPVLPPLPTVVHDVRVHPTHRAVLSAAVQVSVERIVSKFHHLVFFAPRRKGAIFVGVDVVRAVKKLSIQVAAHRLATMTMMIERTELVLAGPVVEVVGGLGVARVVRGVK